jgi:hypothetical protein
MTTPIPTRAPKKRALLVGCNYQGTSHELAGCINDVQNYKQWIASHGFGNEVRVLDDSPDTDKAHQSTFFNICQGIQWLIEGAQPGDTLLFTFSGHGSSIPDKLGQELDYQNEVIIPTDYERFGALIDDKLRVMMVDPLPAGVNLIVVADCCMSGTVLDLKYKVASAEWKEDGKVIRAQITAQKNCPETKCNVVCFSGCDDGNYSADTYEDGMPQGAFSWAFLKSLNDVDKTSLFSDSPKTFIQVFMETAKYLEERGYPQRAQCSFGNSVTNLNVPIPW